VSSLQLQVATSFVTLIPAGMAEVQIVTTDKNTTDLTDGQGVEPNEISVNSQPEPESKPVSLFL